MGFGLSTRRRQIQILLQIAFRNLVASRAKSLIVGGIILFGALLVVVGSALLDSVDSGMRRSIQESLGGHIQVYDARSRDDLALYGGMMGESDLEPIEDFARLKKTLLGVPNVKTVVPMGMDTAFVAMGNLLDVALERLRDDVRRCLSANPSPPPVKQTPIRLGKKLPTPSAVSSSGLLPRKPEVASVCAASTNLDVQYQAHRAHVQRMVRLLQGDLAQAQTIVELDARDTADRARNQADLERATSEAFWRSFDQNALDSLEFLENRIAPISVDGGFLWIRYAGTDLDTFQQAFPGMEIVEGTAVPHGQRGILLAKFYADEFLKLRTARRLDRINDARKLLHRRIAEDEELQRWVKENLGATRDILLQLDPIRANQATTRLKEALKSEESDLPKLLVELLTVNDENFDEHYRIFYDQLGPLLQLYPVKVGDTITIKAAARSGYMNSVNVKVYGFIQFKGLEKSLAAGITCLMDIQSFRDLYGFLTADRVAEIQKLKTRAGVHAVSRENAESELFGDSSNPAQPSQTVKASAIDENRLLSEAPATQKQADLFQRVYTQEEIDSGVAKNAAVILKDSRRLDQTLRDIRAAVERDGFKIKAVDWQKASGMIGQFVTLARLILFIAVFIIFAVALVIINNAMVMATLQRVKEIGTMRAIGAQRRFVVVMLLVETVAVGLLFGALGALLGTGLIWLLRAVGGIPASNDQMYFFFSGPSLIPQLGTTNLVWSLAVVLIVSVLSGLYPALIATRVAPVEAMQSDD